MKQKISIVIIFVLLLGIIPIVPIANAASKPNIVITSYTTSPSSIDPGEQFSVSMTIKNKGAAAASNITVAVSGSSFNPVGSGNSDFVTSLNASSETTLTFNLQSDGSTTSTRENLTVDFSYEDISEVAYASSQTIGITFSKKAGTDQAKPRLYISSYSTSPSVIKAGQRFTLKLKVKNKGDATASNITTSAVSTVAKVLKSSSKKFISSIQSGNTNSLYFKMIADKSITGNSEATLDLTYEDSSENSYTASQTVGLVLLLKTTTTKAKALDPTAPKVLISSYKTTPGDIAPGTKFGLDLFIKNKTSGAVKNVVVSIGSASSAGSDSAASGSTSSSTKDTTASSTSSESFAAIGSSNTQFLSNISSHGSKNIRFNVMTGPSVSAGLYNLTINMNYLDSKNKKISTSETIGLIVKRKPSLSIAVNNKPTNLLAGDAYNFSFDVFNLSDFTIKGVVISALGDGITAEVNKDSKYLGTIESGDSETIEVKGKADFSGQKNVILRIQYRDDFGQSQIVEKSISLKVQERQSEVKKDTQKMKPKKESKSFLSRIVDFFKSLLGIG